MNPELANAKAPEGPVWLTLPSVGYADWSSWKSALSSRLTALSVLDAKFSEGTGL